MKNYEDIRIENCPVASVQKIVHGKWTMVIIYFFKSWNTSFW